MASGANVLAWPTVSVPADQVLYWALYVEHPADRDCAICVGLFLRWDEAHLAARSYLAERAAISIEPGVMARAEWVALEEVPDDFEVVPPPRTHGESSAHPDAFRKDAPCGP